MSSRVNFYAKGLGVRLLSSSYNAKRNRTACSAVKSFGVVKAAVAERLEKAGAVLIAKLATNPFAGGGVASHRQWDTSEAQARAEKATT